MAIKTQYKLQYITDDGKVFDTWNEAKAHEGQIEDTKNVITSHLLSKPNVR